MSTVRTHYDNLQVSRSASLAEIKAARRRLIQQHHPDKNLHHIKKAERRFRLIEDAYKVLADSERRREHDEWIAQSEAECRHEQSATESLSLESGINLDPLYEQAVAIVVGHDQASISLLQRHLRIGYTRAKQIIDMMHRDGLIVPEVEVACRDRFEQGYRPQPSQGSPHFNQRASLGQEDIDISAVAQFLIVVIGGGIGLCYFGYGLEVAAGIALTLLVRLFVPATRFHRSFIIFVLVLMIGEWG